MSMLSPIPAPLEGDELQKIIQGPGDVEWKYEMRRECQEILPGLLLGPLQASKSKETLQKLGVTHILCVRDVRESFAVKNRFPEDFIYKVLDVADNEEQNLIVNFTSTYQWILDAINNGGKVLVHCNGGISLSPTFVVMFVMVYYQLSWEDALHMVQNRRYCISPNGGFLAQIKEYESIYRARIAVEQYKSQIAQQTQQHGLQAPTPTPKEKRNIDEVEADEDETNDKKRPAIDEQPSNKAYYLHPMSTIPVKFAEAPGGSSSSYDPDAMDMS